MPDQSGLARKLDKDKDAVSPLVPDTELPKGQRYLPINSRELLPSDRRREHGLRAEDISPATDNTFMTRRMEDLEAQHPHIDPFPSLGEDGTAPGVGPFDYDFLVDANWATEVTEGRGVEGKLFTTIHGHTFRIYSTLQGAIDRAEADQTTRSILLVGITTEAEVAWDPGEGNGYNGSLIIHAVDSTGTTGVPESRLTGNFTHKGRQGTGHFLVLENFSITGTLTASASNQGERMIGRRMKIGGNTQLEETDYKFSDCSFADIILRNQVKFAHFRNCRVNDIDGNAASADTKDLQWIGGRITGSVTLRDASDIYIDTLWDGTGDDEDWYVKILSTRAVDHDNITIRGQMNAKDATTDAKWYVLFVDEGFTDKIVTNVLIDLICEKPTNTTNEVHYFESTMNNAIRAANIRINCGVTGGGTKLEDMANGWVSVKGVFTQSTFMMTPCDAEVDLTGSVSGSNCILSGTDTAGLVIDGTDFLRKDGTTALTGNWNPGNFTIGNYDFAARMVSQAVGDANFALALVGSNPYVGFDTNDQLIYDRENNKWVFQIGGIPVLTIDANGTSHPYIVSFSFGWDPQFPQSYAPD